MRLLLLLASAMLASSALAQTPGSCEVGTAQAFLEVSDVQASLFNTGALFFGGSTTSGDGYLVPKASGNSPIFAASLWLGGKVNGEIRTSHSRYGNRQMWPGPLNADGTLPNPDDCLAYDRIWVVSTYDVAIYEQTGFASSDLADWPIGLGAPAVDANGLAVEVTGRDQMLDLRAGERPVISGTQTAFWVMNDVGNEHLRGVYNPDTQTFDYIKDSDPLGVEVAVTAFAVVSDETALHQGTYYSYTVTNRNDSSITEAYLGFYVDPDLGDAADDYVGADTTRGLAFVYNDSNEDAAYGSPPPAAGFDLLTGFGRLPAIAKRNPGGARYQSEGVYDLLRGLWLDGSPIYQMGHGYQQPSGKIVTSMYPGDPVTGSFWSEVNIDGSGTNSSQGDRQMGFVAPVFELAPGESQAFALAVIFGQGTDNLNSITELRAASDRVQAAFDDGSLFKMTPPTPLLATPEPLAPADGASFHLESVTLSWTPVPGATLYHIQQSLDPSFEDASSWASDSTSTWGGWYSPQNQPVTGYWRVRAANETQRGVFSPSRRLTTYFYSPRMLLLSDGSPAFVEVSGPDGDNPCTEGAQSRDGCDEVGGNLVYESLNSTGDYYLSEQSTGSEATIGLYAPNDFEIRFTDTGSLGFWRFQDGAITRLPIEIWDIGTVTPGDVNDPADDVQLIPVVFSDNGGTCVFDPEEITPGRIEGYVESDRLYAYYPTTSYADFELAFADSVATATDGCYLDSDHTANNYTVGARPIQRQVFGSSSDAPALPATGTVIRIYTTDPLPVSEEALPRAGDLTLGPAFPNPTASSLTVPYTLARPSPVELAIYDVLGRRVIEQATTRQLEGTHTATLNVSALAPGVYVVRLRAGDETRTTRITVVR